MGRILSKKIKCPVCKRKKFKAIEEQVALGNICGCDPIDSCAFKDDILKAIETSKTPHIYNFNVSLHDIFSGQSIIVYWEVDNCSNVKLLINGIPQPKSLPFSHSFEIRNIVEDIEVGLALSDVDGQEYFTNKENITVYKEVKIKFETDKKFTLQTLPILLSWEVENAEEIIINPGGIDGIIQNSIPVFPDNSTVYTLTAKNKLDKKVESKHISVIPLVQVNKIDFPKLPQLNQFDVLYKTSKVTIPVLESTKVNIKPKRFNLSVIPNLTNVFKNTGALKLNTIDSFGALINYINEGFRQETRKIIELHKKIKDEKFY